MHAASRWPSSTAWLIAGGAALGFYALALSIGIVWNDTSTIATFRLDFPDARLFTGFWSTLGESFGGTGPLGYRPLEGVLARSGIGLVGLGSVSRALWLVPVAGLMGLTALAHYAVARRILESRAQAGLAVLLFVCSAPFLTGAIVYLVSIQAIVPLAASATLLAVWSVQAATSGGARALWLTALAALLLLAPWYKEVLILCPLLVIAADLEHRRRPTWLSAVGVAGLLHALFPTALARLLFAPDLPLQWVFGMGVLARELAASGEASGLLAEIRATRWWVSLYFLSLVPPSLLLIASAGFARDALGQLLESDRARRAAAGLAALAGLGALALFPLLPPDSTILRMARIGSLLAVGAFVAAGLATRPILGIWLALTLAPFYRVFTEIVHLGYALAPASIVVAAGIGRLVRSLHGTPWQRAAAALVAVLALDSLFLVHGVWRVNRSNNVGISAVSDALRDRLPAGSIVVSNALHAYDIRLAADGRFDVHFTTVSGSPDYKRVETPEKLRALLAGGNPVYLLDIRHAYRPDKAALLRHPYVAEPPAPLEALGLLHRTRTVYPFLDPLRNLIPRPFVSFLGAPDLVNDFYHGPRQDGGVFQSEVSAEYWLFRIAPRQTGTAGL